MLHTFVIEGEAVFRLEVNENKVVILPSPSSRTASNLPTVRRPRVKNDCASGKSVQYPVDESLVECHRRTGGNGEKKSRCLAGESNLDPSARNRSPYRLSYAILYVNVYDPLPTLNNVLS